MIYDLLCENSPLSVPQCGRVSKPHVVPEQTSRFLRLSSPLCREACWPSRGWHSDSGGCAQSPVFAWPPFSFIKRQSHPTLIQGWRSIGIVLYCEGDKYPLSFSLCKHMYIYTRTYIHVYTYVPIYIWVHIIYIVSICNLYINIYKIYVYE